LFALLPGQRGTFRGVEETLNLADLGVETVEKTITKLREVTKREGYIKGEDIERALEEILTELIDIGGGLKLETKPSVILMIGVNGVGKTTTIGKLAMKYINDGKKVLYALATPSAGGGRTADRMGAAHRCRYCAPRGGLRPGVRHF
jgi:signal recognition particle GTPase